MCRCLYLNSDVKSDLLKSNVLNFLFNSIASDVRKICHKSFLYNLEVLIQYIITYIYFCDVWYLCTASTHVRAWIKICTYFVCGETLCDIITRSSDDLVRGQHSEFPVQEFTMYNHRDFPRITDLHSVSSRTEDSLQTESTKVIFYSIILNV